MALQIRTTQWMEQNHLFKIFFEVYDDGNGELYAYFDKHWRALEYVDLKNSERMKDQALGLVKAIARLDHRIVWQNEARAILEVPPKSSEE